MKAYLSYKESGIKWIGQIPEHWVMANVGRMMTLGRGRVISNIEIGENSGEYPVYSSQTSDNGVMGYINTYDFEGDYVTWTTDGANAGRVFFRTGKFNCTNVCGTMKPKNEKVYPPFIPYLLNLGTKYYVRYDINPKLMNGEMAQIEICLPSIDEQKTIVNFLDRKTAQIDTLIEKKQRQIDLLQEQRTALINHAVTKGLNPKVKMKDSGVEWLGEIPNHWRMTNVRHENMAGRLEHQDGNHGEIHPKAEDYVDAGIPFVMANNVKNGELDIVNDCKYISKEQADNLRVGFAITDDVLLTHKGTIGRVAIVGTIPTEYIMLTPQVTYYRCKEGIYNKYLKWLFESHCFQTQLGIISSKGTTRDYIGIVAQNDLILHLPPIKEQEDIVKWLENEVSPINDTVKHLERLLVFLKEYRTALISEAVTGKIDVRAVHE